MTERVHLLPYDSGKLTVLWMRSPWSWWWLWLIKPLHITTTHTHTHTIQTYTHTHFGEIEVAVSVAKRWGALYQGSNWDGRWKGERGSDNHPHKFLAAVQLYPAASTTSWTPITAGKARLVREPVTPPCNPPSSLPPYHNCRQEIAKSKTMCDVLWCLNVSVCVCKCVCV